MSNWQKVRLGDVCSIKHGYAFKGEFFSDTPTDCVLTTPGNFKIGGGFKCDKPKYYNGEVPQEYILAENDIIVTMTDLSKAGDTLGYSALVPNSGDITFLHNQRIGLVHEVKDNINKLFLYWLLRTRDYQQYIVGCASGSTVKHTSPKSILQFDFLLPPLAEQERIAGILGALDDKIECNNRINRNLEEQAQALFRRWFVDFEFPDPNNAGKPYRSSGGSFIDSPLGKIPQGWTVGTFGEIAELIAGGDKPNVVSEIQTSECNVPIFSNGISNEGLYGYTTIARIYNESVTISARGTIGYVCLRQNPYLPIVRLISVTPNKNIISAKYLFHWLRTANINGTGTTQQQLTVPDFKKTIILIPNFEIICNFTNVVDFLYNHIETSKVQNKNLAKLRDTLLPKLMNGEI